MWPWWVVWFKLGLVEHTASIHLLMLAHKHIQTHSHKCLDTHTHTHSLVPHSEYEYSVSRWGEVTTFEPIHTGETWNSGALFHCTRSVGSCLQQQGAKQSCTAGQRHLQATRVHWLCQFQVGIEREREGEREEGKGRWGWEGRGEGERERERGRERGRREGEREKLRLGWARLDHWHGAIGGGAHLFVIGSNHFRLLVNPIRPLTALRGHLTGLPWPQPVRVA